MHNWMLGFVLDDQEEPTMGCYGKQAEEMGLGNDLDNNVIITSAGGGTGGRGDCVKDVHSRGK